MDKEQEVEVENILEEIAQIMAERKFPISVQETAMGTIDFSSHKMETAKKVLEIVKTAQTPKEVVKSLQPIIKS